MNGQETVSGGGTDWGFRGSFGDKFGSAYRAGDGTLIPAAYRSTDEWGELGYDINPHRHFSFLYQREDQNGVQNPCEFFDTNYLGSYGFQAGLVDDDPTAPWSKLNTSVWYNNTRFNGNTNDKSLDTFPVMQYVNESLDYQFGQPYGTFNLHGQTQGSAYSAGARPAVTFGQKGETQVTAGGDFRYTEQVITENYQYLSLSGVSRHLPVSPASSQRTCPRRGCSIPAPTSN